MKITKSLPELPYDIKALSPIITEETLNYHYGKHHAAYVNNLAGLIVDTPLVDANVEDIILKSYSENNVALFNNAAQHWNHTFFWHSLSPNRGKSPNGKIGKMINRDFGSFENFKEQFSTTAVKLFGSGWAWLAQNDTGKLEIVPMKDAHTPLTENKTPILTLDVWEHAYYIDYRNARPKFVEGFWDLVNWEFANQNLLKMSDICMRHIEEYWQTLTVSNNDLFANGNFSKALSGYKNALYRSEVLNNNMSQCIRLKIPFIQIYIISCNNLANTYQKLGNHDEAETMLKRVIFYLFHLIGKKELNSNETQSELNGQH